MDHQHHKTPWLTRSRSKKAICGEYKRKKRNKIFFLILKKRFEISNPWTKTKKKAEQSSIKQINDVQLHRNRKNPSLQKKHQIAKKITIIFSIQKPAPTNKESYKKALFKQFYHIPSFPTMKSHKIPLFSIICCNDCVFICFNNNHHPCRVLYDTEHFWAHSI